MTLKKTDIPNGRDGVWFLIRTLKEFTLPEIASYSDLKQDTVRDYLRLLTKREYLLCAKDKNSNNKHNYYKLIQDNGKYRPDLSFSKPSGRQRIWMALKPLKQFTFKDVSLVSEVSDSEAKRYLMYLRKAGYIRIIKPSKPNGSPAIYIFNKRKDTGPRAPLIRIVEEAVYDANTNEKVWSSKESEAL